ncbi:putative porin [Acinetobacter chinensis]|uniref:Putative porin n=1 Tax=Acinetobacter chinensis TaxID=2004650 RepID=A0A3B7M2V1_9GAMM|nr:putative porin [Acinetobacter chinensis]AXY58157.1 putative porin [Acinetobacter chinensis]
MLKKIALAAALTASFGVAHAYQAEINAGYEKTDFDDSESGDLYSFGGKYYLNSVETKNAPLAEAAFVNKASNVGAAYSKYSEDDEGFEFKIESYGVSGEFFIPDSQFYVSGSLNKSKVTVEIEEGKASDSNTGYALEAGYLPVDGLLIAAGISKENIDAANAGQEGMTRTFSRFASDADDTAFTLRGKYVTQIGNNYVNFEGLSSFGDETYYQLGADLYIDPTLSVGASFADSTMDDFDTIFGVRAQKFFTPAIAVGVNYTTTDGADSYGINGTFRF